MNLLETKGEMFNAFLSFVLTSLPVILPYKGELLMYDQYPKIPEEVRVRRLQPPVGKIHMVQDTDTFNEIDDQAGDRGDRRRARGLRPILNQGMLMRCWLSTCGNI